MVTMVIPEGNGGGGEAGDGTGGTNGDGGRCGPGW